MKKSRHGDQDQAADGAAAAVVAQAPRAPLTDRINADPPILNGMTASEGVKIAVICLIVYGLAGLAILMATGLWPAAMVLVLFGTLGTTWYASIYLARIKRGRPEGYYNLAIHLWLAGHGLTKSKFILYTGYWSLGRDMPLGGFTSPLVVHERARPAQTPARKIR